MAYFELAVTSMSPTSLPIFVPRLILFYSIRLVWYFARRFAWLLHGILWRVFRSIFYNLWLWQDLASGWQTLWWFSSCDRSTARLKSFCLPTNEVTVVQCGWRRRARSCVDVQVSLEKVFSPFQRLKRETNIRKFYKDKAFFRLN